MKYRVNYVVVKLNLVLLGGWTNGNHVLINTSSN
jgi:hypothetical protein